MKVTWGGSFESKEGREKITLYVPDGSEDDLYFLKKAIRQGKGIELVVSGDNPQSQEPPEVTELTNIIRPLFESAVEKRVQEIMTLKLNIDQEG